MDRFNSLGIIKNEALYEEDKLNSFTSLIGNLKIKKEWNKDDLLNGFFAILPDFEHKEMGKYLDSKM